MNADPRTPFPDTAYDGGSPSAEALGRGNTFATGLGNAASGSLNPAALTGDTGDSFYTTALVYTDSDINEGDTRATDPLNGKVLRYLAMGSGKGVFFYEPMARKNAAEEPSDPFSSPMDRDQYDLNADAIGFGGADTFLRTGSMGISISYLRASMAETPYDAGVPGKTQTDTADGVRVNFGLRYPTGPALWGLTVQNAPGFLWWKHYKRDLLPVKVRVGNAYRLYPGTIISFEAENRFYKEGAHSEDYYYTGLETAASDLITLRFGVFANELDDPDSRHWTGGLTVKTGADVLVSYAMESFEENEKKIQRSYVSVSFPFVASDGAP